MAKFYRGVKVSNGTTATHAVVHDWDGELISVVGCRATRKGAMNLYHSELKKS